MIYEQPYKKRRARRKRKKRGSFGGFLLKLLALVLLIAVIAAGVLYIVPVSLFAVEPEGVELGLTDGLPSSRINVLLLGTDVLSENSQRSDAIIIASIGYRSVRLTSVLRDTVVSIPGHGSTKLNAAYAYGGPELVMRTLNENFGLNILYYVTADFVSLARVVDAIGGIDIAVTEAEMEQININVWDARGVFLPLGYTITALEDFGSSVHLNGMQALGYARIRKLDSDFRRASRQRVVLTAILQKVRGNLWNPVLLTRLARAVFGALDTNLSPVALLSIGEKALMAGDIAQQRMPVDGSYTDDGSAIYINDRQKNIDAFRAFAYDTAQ